MYRLDGFMENNTCATSWKGVTEINICLASRKRCHGKRHGNSEVRTRNGNASWKAILVERHGKSVMECITETGRRAASRKVVMQTGGCGASRNSRHGMRNGKHQRSQNVALSEYHGKVLMDSLMESNTCATSWKGVKEINICLASRKRRHGMRYGNTSDNRM